MQKYLIWHHLLLKRQMKKRTFLPLLLLMIFLLWLLQNMAFPDSKNLTVLLYNGGGEYGERLTDSLMRTESVFDFRLAENQAALEEEVAAGKAECGFEIGPEFAQNVTNGSTKDLIRYVASSLTARGIVARETVYTTFLDLYSENILQGAEGKIFGSGSPDLADAALGRYREYLDGSRIFHTDFETVSGTPGEPAAPAAETQPLRGIVGILIFMAMMFSRGEDIHAGSGNLQRYLPEKEKRRFLLLKYFTAAEIPAVIGLTAIRIRYPQTSLPKELMLFVFFLIWCCLWVYLFGKIFRNEITFAGWMLSLLLINCLLCPVFWNIGTVFLPAAAVSCVLPVGAWLKLVSVLL